MSDDPQPAFDDALEDLTAIRRFLRKEVAALRQEEAALAPQWRPTFRARLPFYRLLNSMHRDHLRGIFSHLLPPRGLEVERFDKEARVLLDVLSETYISQAGVFADLAEEYHYQVVALVHRHAPGRVVVLSLSGSIFVLGEEDAALRRPYRYQNIYGNDQIDAEGRCWLRTHLRRQHRIQTSEFHSSPVLLLAVHPEAAGFRMDFGTESRSISMTLSTRIRSVSMDLSRSVQEYTNVIPFPGRGGGGDPGETDEEGGPGETDEEGGPGETDGGGGLEESSDRGSPAESSDAGSRSTRDPREKPTGQDE